MRTSQIGFMMAVATLLGALLSGGCSRPLSDRPVVAESRVNEIRSNLASGEGGGSGSGGGDEQEPTGWVTVRGSFKFAAADIPKVPKPTALSIGGDDAAVCRQGGTPMSETVVVDSSGGLKNVVVFLADDLTRKSNADKWLHPSATGATDPVIFDQKNCVFLTHVLAVQVDQPMEILNSDSVGHNTALSDTPFNKIIPPGGKETYTYREEFRLPSPAKCSIHPWMNAYIFPRNNGYVAVTADDGTFTIENLPAGVDVSLKFWHEKVGLLKSVKIGGQAATLPSGGYAVNWEPGEQQLDVTVDVAPFTE